MRYGFSNQFLVHEVNVLILSGFQQNCYKNTLFFLIRLSLKVKYQKILHFIILPLYLKTGFGFYKKILTFANLIKVDGFNILSTGQIE